MNQSVDMIWLVIVLVFALSTLVALRPSFAMLVRSLAAWGAIGLVIYVAVAHRQEIGAMVSRATDSLGLDEQQTQGETVRIRMSPDGHFWARARLNGVERRMLIDSGATTTAISSDTAAAVGVGTDGGFPVMIETANGAVEARRGRIGKVGVGPLQTDDLGVVIAPNFGELDVLGMNFLSRLKSWRVEGNVLILEPGEARKVNVSLEGYEHGPDEE